MDKLIVTILGTSIIFFIYWFFFGKNLPAGRQEEEAMEAEEGKVEIIVSGGYNPDTISIPKGKSTTISFLRKDPSTCLEEVVLSEFKIRKFLTLNQKTEITITPKKSGTFPFSCGMNMFHGKVIIK